MRRILTLLVLLAASVSVFAARIANATVTAVAVETKFSRTAPTNSAGLYFPLGSPDRRVRFN